MKERVSFQITRLEASVPEGVPIKWQDKEFGSGPLTIALDPEAHPAANRGLLDYKDRNATAEFHVVLRFQELSDTLTDLGAAPEFARPVKAVLRSQGSILDDHSFALSGGCRICAHALFRKGDARASVLPGH